MDLYFFKTFLSFQKYPFHLLNQNGFSPLVKYDMYDDVLLQNKEPHQPYALSSRGPAIDPSFVTCPTIKIAIPFVFAIRINSAVHSRTCETLPGADVTSG